MAYIKWNLIGLWIMGSILSYNKARADTIYFAGTFLFRIHIYDLDCTAPEIYFAYLVLAKFVLLILVDNLA